MKKLVLSLSLVLAFSSATAAFAAIPQNIRIGTDPTYAPFESKNSQGELVGFDIDLAKELCKRINTQCTFVENPLDALIPSLKAKKIDAIMSSLSITEKRQQEIALQLLFFYTKLFAGNKFFPKSPLDEFQLLDFFLGYVFIAVRDFHRHPSHGFGHKITVANVGEGRAQRE